MDKIVKDEKNFANNIIQEKPICIVSDFHGIYEAMNLVRKKIREEHEKVAILGDCMDRGNEGMKIMSEIKSMEENDEDIIYIPGNHDDLLYLNFKIVIDEYRRLKDEDRINDEDLKDLGKVIFNIIYRIQNELYAKANGLVPTMQEIGCMCATLEGVKDFLDLMLWLENQPLLRIELDCDGKKIAMGHAAFDMDLYNQEELFTLRTKAQDEEIYGNLKNHASDSQDFFESKKKVAKAFTCLWYRNPNDMKDIDFDRTVRLPRVSEADIIVVGHSPQQMEVEIIGENITRKAIDVDGGTVECYMSGKGKMLKFEPHKEEEPTYEEVQSFKNPKKLGNNNVLRISDLLNGENSTYEQDDVKVYIPKGYEEEEEEEEEVVKIWVPKSKKKIDADVTDSCNGDQAEDFEDR